MKHDGKKRPTDSKSTFSPVFLHVHFKWSMKGSPDDPEVNQNVTKDSSEIEEIEKGLDLIKNKTCLRFTKRLNQPDYVSIIRGNGCYSNLGKTGGMQALSLGLNCVIPGIVAHEFLHAAGVAHQHQRPDRDQFILVHFEKIPQDWKLWFEKITDERYSTYNVTYDVTSIMHYAPTKPGLWENAITSLVGDQDKIGQREHLSSKDAEFVNRMYDCKSHLK